MPLRANQASAGVALASGHSPKAAPSGPSRPSTRQIRPRCRSRRTWVPRFICIRNQTAARLAPNAARVAGTPCKWNHPGASLAPNAALVFGTPCIRNQTAARLAPNAARVVLPGRHGLHPALFMSKAPKRSGAWMVPVLDNGVGESPTLLHNFSSAICGGEESRHHNM